MFGKGANNTTNRTDKNITVNNTVVQNFKTPRSLTAPRSVRQQSQAAIGGLSRAHNYD